MFECFVQNEFATRAEVSRRRSFSLHYNFFNKNKKMKNVKSNMPAFCNCYVVKEI